MTEENNLQLHDQLCFALYAASAAVTRAYRPLLDGIGLTYPQYLVMLVLWQGDDVSVGRLARALSLPPHGLGPVLKRMASAGLIVRRADPEDARVVRVALTERGRELERQASQVQADVVCQTELTSPALGVLREQLHDLVRTLSGDPDFALLPSTTQLNLSIGA